MIRSILIIFGLLLGMALAAATSGNIGHLRSLADDRLPEWTRQMSPDSGLMQGTITIVASKSKVHWNFLGVSSQGLTYKIKLDGGGLDVTGTTEVPWSGSRLSTTLATGEVDLAKAHPSAGEVGISGLLLIDALNGSFDLNNFKILSLAGHGVIVHGSYDGTAIGDVTLELTQGEVGVWLAQFAIPTGAIQISASARGRFDEQTAHISGTVSDTENLPQGLRRGFAQTLGKSADGWQIDHIIDLKTLTIQP